MSDAYAIFDFKLLQLGSGRKLKNEKGGVKKHKSFNTAFCFELFTPLKTLLEFINASACINKLLFAGEEGMALRANFNADLAVCVSLC